MNCPGCGRRLERGPRGHCYDCGRFVSDRAVSDQALARAVSDQALADQILGRSMGKAYPGPLPRPPDGGRPTNRSRGAEAVNMNDDLEMVLMVAEQVSGAWPGHDVKAAVVRLRETMAQPDDDRIRALAEAADAAANCETCEHDGNVLAIGENNCEECLGAVAQLVEGTPVLVAEVRRLRHGLRSIARGEYHATSGIADGDAMNAARRVLDGKRV